MASADLDGHILGHSVASGDKVWHLSAINKVRAWLDFVACAGVRLCACKYTGKYTVRS